MLNKNYIFLTNEGHTFQENSNSDAPDIFNLQVIGIIEGENPESAFDNLMQQNAYLKDTSFSKIFCYELASGYEGTRRDFAIKPSQLF